MALLAVSLSELLGFPTLTTITRRDLEGLAIFASLGELRLFAAVGELHRLTTFATPSISKLRIGSAVAPT